MIQPGEFDAKMLMAICTVGLCSGGIIAFLPDRKLCVVFSALMMLPSATFMLVLDENRSLAVMIFLFFVYMYFISKRGNSEYWKAYENEYNLWEKKEKLKKLSRTDVLTGLFNRGYFDELFESEWKRASREAGMLSLAICDIDHFKQVNDTFGHLAGDEYLKKIAEILTNVFKRDTDFVARYGGEEFVVLLPYTSAVLAFDLAETVRKRVEQTQLDYNGKLIQTTISFGLACLVPNYKESSSKLVSMADEALYQAKQEGRNRVKTAGSD